MKKRKFYLSLSSLKFWYWGTVLICRLSLVLVFFEWWRERIEGSFVGLLLIRNPNERFLILSSSFKRALKSGRPNLSSGSFIYFIMLLVFKGVFVSDSAARANFLVGRSHVDVLSIHHVSCIMITVLSFWNFFPLFQFWCVNNLILIERWVVVINDCLIKISFALNLQLMKLYDQL